jgi:hypothetical protein
MSVDIRIPPPLCPLQGRASTAIDPASGSSALFSTQPITEVNWPAHQLTLPAALEAPNLLLRLLGVNVATLLATLALLGVGLWLG